jgi:hypothetical protein
VGEVLGANLQAATSKKWPCGRKHMESGHWDCMSMSTQGMRCKGTRVMWQGERMQWQRRVVG